MKVFISIFFGKNFFFYFEIIYAYIKCLNPLFAVLNMVHSRGLGRRLGGH